MEFYKYVVIVCMIVFVSALLFLISLNFARERFVTIPQSHQQSTMYTVIPKEEFSKIVSRSDYFQRMTEADILARNARSKENYMYTYINAYDEFTPQEHEMLSRSIFQVDNKLKQYRRINTINWRFAKVMDIVENGYPHTLEDVIILSSKFFTKYEKDMLKTLLHEKLHVYQRIFPDATQKLLQMWGFSRCNVPEEIKHKARNNPDIEGTYCYKQYATMQMYITQRPLSLAESMSKTFDIATGDVAQNDIFPDYIHQSEHPYEVMASMIPIIVFDPRKEESDSTREKNMFYSLTKTWMLAYL